QSPYTCSWSSPVLNEVTLSFWRILTPTMGGRRPSHHPWALLLPSMAKDPRFSLPSTPVRKFLKVAVANNRNH
ncbi:hypothetical protein QT231_23580, partial [Halomonas sp. SpR1]|uniref:hypothetical protein n=1 Tax=Halomonas sp. SpR1 TaxID=3050462 RepID=UPI0027E545A4